MSYADFARAISILDGPNDAWKPWHRQQTDAVLNAVASIEGKARKKPMALDYSRVVEKSSRIVRK
jgi:hypothetical protein